MHAVSFLQRWRARRAAKLSESDRLVTWAGPRMCAHAYARSRVHAHAFSRWRCVHTHAHIAMCAGCAQRRWCATSAAQKNERRLLLLLALGASAVEGVAAFDALAAEVGVLGVDGPAAAAATPNVLFVLQPYGELLERLQQSAGGWIVWVERVAHVLYTHVGREAEDLKVRPQV